MSGTVLFDTIAAGGGHVATARAMRDALERASAGALRGEVRDAMKELGLERQDREHKRAWARLLRWPWAVRTGQRAMELAPALVHAAESRWLDPLARRLAADPRARSAQLIVVNHGFLMVGYARARLRYGLERPVVTFATEPFDANALWAEPRAERVIAPSHPARAHLIRLGVPARRIDVIGYPVAAAILDAPPQRAARQALGLAPGRWALLSLGGEGVVDRPERWIEAMLAAGWRVMAVAGRNQALARRLAGHREAGAALQVHGFVDDMPLRLAAVDAVVGKAGPASTLEALATGRPFLATSHAGLNEAAVVAYLERSGLGARVRTPDRLARKLAGLESPQRRWRPDFATMSDALGRHLRALAVGEASPSPVGLERDPWRPDGGPA